ncbi:hypothetical protein LZ198_34060 [Myxococcus sp. K15C18031901]|uniref:hypothetical protein n=1 Tax=Myxococcus dinghuensis TaxID=2906761 RepID=UPI0020A80EA9|nr:hypothetical protein [Myxococcus dinghuensis]MCP3103913.1 hypothetical protein [Myxococcus dinghuensis]
MQKRMLMLCLALGLTACGPQTAEESTEPSTESATQSLELPPGPTVCDMDGCPSGMCATRVGINAMCPGGYMYYCSTIVPGQTRCI